MGREASAVVRWQGAEALCTVALESQLLILRGGIRARIARSSIDGQRVAGEWLVIDVEGSELHINLGAAVAAKWSAVLAKPPPTLAEKLGIGPQCLPWVLGETPDAAFEAALAGGRAATAAAAGVLIAILAEESDLSAVLAATKTLPALSIWCIHPKGPGNRHWDGLVRTRLREAGYVDTKTSAVSDRLTATRYTRRR